MASEAVLRRLNRIGQGAISAEQGLLSLTAILQGAAATATAPQLPQLAVNGFIWDTYLKPGQPAPAFFAEFASEAGGSGRRGWWLSGLRQWVWCSACMHACSCSS